MSTLTAMPQKVTRYETVWGHVGDGYVVLVKGNPYVARRDPVDDRAFDLYCSPRECPKCPHPGRPHPGRAVVVLYPGDPFYAPPIEDAAAKATMLRHGARYATELALAGLAVKLGASVIAERGPDDHEFTCPPADPGSKRGRRLLVDHLLLFHAPMPDKIDEDDDLEALHEVAAVAEPHVHKGS